MSKPATARDVKATEDSNHEEFHDLGPALEQFDLYVKYNPTSNPALKQLWAPADDSLYLLLPTKAASTKLVTFALSTFGWMHRAVRVDHFLQQHDDFWSHLEDGQPVIEEQRPWLALWLSLLSVGLQELHNIGFLRTPRVESIQTILVLTLCTSNNGDHQQEWVMLGACINMTRAMDMHRLGSEESFDNTVASRVVWATPGGRELGRRLWWNIVICDW